MENIQLLQAMLTVHADNFRMLHWKACGKNFDSAHKIAGDYYEMLSGDIDDVAEVMLRDDILPLNMLKCAQLVLNHGTNVQGITSSNDYDKEDIIEYSDKILGEIVNTIKITLEDYQVEHSVGCKAYLEGLYDKYDKEWRYLNKRRGI